MKAIAINNKSASVVSDRPKPKLRPDYLLVKVKAIALNPTDWKHIDSDRAPPNGLAGCDYSGVVEEVGTDVKKSFQKDDRVCGCAHGANYSNIEDGVFAEYAVVKGDVQIKLPESLSFEQAATLTLGVTTVGQGLYQKGLKLNLPTNPTKSGEYVLIYGGSSATGSLGIQFATLSGYKVLTTCSPRNFSFVKSLGAVEAFDYNEADVGSKIRSFTDDKLKFAWDTISLEPSANICAEALSSNGQGCRYGTILPVKLPRDDGVETVSTFMYTIFGEKFEKGGKEFPASQEDFEFAKTFIDVTEKLLAEGKLKTHPEKVGEDGLQGALKGMDDMRNDKVSGQKLVYKVEETP